MEHLPARARRSAASARSQTNDISIVLSIGIWWFLNGDDAEQKAHAVRFGIFVGLWAPTLLILSNRFDRYADKVQPLPGLDIKDDDEDQS